MREQRQRQTHQYEVLKKLTKSFNLSSYALYLLMQDACQEEGFDILEALRNTGQNDLPACFRIEAEPIGDLAWFDGKTLYKSALWKRMVEDLHRHGEVLTVVHVKRTGDYVMCTHPPKGELDDEPSSGPRPTSYAIEGRDIWRVSLKHYSKLKESENGN